MGGGGGGGGTCGDTAQNSLSEWLSSLFQLSHLQVNLPREFDILLPQGYHREAHLGNFKPWSKPGVCFQCEHPKKLPKKQPLNRKIFHQVILEILCRQIIHIAPKWWALKTEMTTDKCNWAPRNFRRSNHKVEECFMKWFLRYCADK